MTFLRQPMTPSKVPILPHMDTQNHLPSLRLGEGVGEALHVLLQLAVVGQELNVGTIDLDAAGGLLLQVLIAAQGCEAPVLGDDDLLAARELVLGAAQSLKSDGAVGVTGPDTQDDLANVDTGDSAVGFAPGTAHSGLQSIGSGARQHLVDADDVVGVSADTKVESVLAGSLGEVLVGADAGGLEGLGAQLLILVGD